MSQAGNFPDPLTLYLLDKFNNIPGRKAFQKLIYFINLEVDKYRFKWSRSGPFSEEISYLLDDLIFENYVSIKPENPMTIPVSRYNLTLSEIGKKHLKTFKIDKKTRDIVAYVIEFLREKSPREMELLASVHYIVTWAKHSNRKSSIESIYQLLSDLKPDSEFSVEEVKRAISSLEKYR